MLSTALRIFKYNPSLKQVNVRWAREQCPNHLKQEGLYDVVYDKHGRAEALSVIERGIPLVGSPFYRKYKHKLEVANVGVDSRKTPPLISPGPRGSDRNRISMIST